MMFLFTPYTDGSSYVAVFLDDEYLGRVRDAGGSQWYYLDCTMTKQGFCNSREKAARRLAKLLKQNFPD